MGINYSPRIVTDGLVLLLDAANPKSYPGSGTTWYDISGNENNMTLSNTPTINECGILFDGVNQYASGTGMPSFSLDSNYSIEIIFRMMTLPTAEFSNNSHVFLGQMGNNHTIFVYPQENNKSSIGMCYDDSRYNTKHKSSKQIESTEWVNFHVNGYGSTLGDLEYYINGMLDTSRFTSADTNGSEYSSTYYLGRDTRFNTYSNIEISSIKIYNRVLTANEIKQNYNVLRGRFNL